jgi:uncharacterized membrane protein
MKKNLGTGLGIGVGTAIYDYFSHGEIDWIRAVVISIIASLILLAFEKMKKK